MGEGAGMRAGRNGSRLTLDLGPGFKADAEDGEANIRDAGSIHVRYLSHH